MLSAIVFRRGQNPFTISRLFRKMTHHPVKVSVQQGVLVGQECQLPSGKVYQSFLGVPYAVPPLGKLRYRSPVPLKQFDCPELDCSKEGDVSHQRDALGRGVLGSENCLYLNIYSPKNVSRADPLPVMVWIHGGGFWFGSGNREFCFPAKLMEQEVIVVTINYRLGALGFLYLPEEGIYGNAGLKDQRLALQWIQDNISNFNGDPSNVTIFGESAGASSVHLHTYAKHANKLFHKAIMQSGTANMEWVFQNEPAQKTRRLAELIAGSPIGDGSSGQLLQFLQSAQVTPLAILAKTLPVLTPDERRRHLPLAFKPVVEDNNSPDSFIDADILHLMYTKDQVESLPMMMGYNSAEGIAMALNANRKIDVYEEDLARLVPRNLVPNANAPEAQLVAKEMRNFYLNGGALTKDQLNNLVDLLTDYHFNIDMQLAAEIHVHSQTKSPLYFFRFDYVGGRNIYKRIFQMEHLRGASHGDELYYLFQSFGDETPVSKDDAFISQHLCELWTNFARTGKPSDKWTEVQKPPKNESFQLDYYVIDRECGMRQNPDAKRIEFWRNMYQKYNPNCYKILRAKL